MRPELQREQELNQAVVAVRRAAAALVRAVVYHLECKGYLEQAERDMGTKSEAATAAAAKHQALRRAHLADDGALKAVPPPIILSRILAANGEEEVGALLTFDDGDTFDTSALDFSSEELDRWKEFKESLASEV